MVADEHTQPESQRLPLLIVVVGPTASGKSELAAQLAAGLGAEVISCDSVAVYRGLEIGAAKPSAAQRAMAPHHMLDVAGPDQIFSAGDYSRKARAAIADIASRGRVPIVAGGTGLYLRALLQGLFAGPQRDDDLRERLRQQAASEGAESVHRMLHQHDPAAAERIHPNDVPKVLRALEVCLSAGTPITEAWGAGAEPLAGYRVVKLGLHPPRAELYARINQRAQQMFAAGLVEETRSLVERYGADCWPLESLGYKQAQAVLRGKMTEAEAIAATAQGHRNYAKRQATWFRKEAAVQWMDGFGQQVIEHARNILAREGHFRPPAEASPKAES